MKHNKFTKAYSLQDFLVVELVRSQGSSQDWSALPGVHTLRGSQMHMYAGVPLMYICTSTLFECDVTICTAFHLPSMSPLFITLSKEFTQSRHYLCD